MKSAPSTPSPELGSSPEPPGSQGSPAADVAEPQRPLTHPPTTPRTPFSVTGLLDVVLVAVGAVVIALGVPAEGYLIGAGAWIALRVVGVAVDRAALAMTPSTAEIVLRLTYLLGRLFALAVTAVIVRNSVSKDDGLTVLVVVAVAFTVEFIISFIHRPRRR